MTEEQVLKMVERFLGWRLPYDFDPDGGISFQKPQELYPLVENPRHLWPTGTNLLDAEQARAMVEYLLNDESA